MGHFGAESGRALRDGHLPMISVVVVTYNSSDCIGECLDALQSHLEPVDEVIVVDNASTDATGELVGMFPGVRWIPQPGNVGYGSAANTGAREARNPILMIMNPDITVSKIDREDVARLASNGRRGLLGGTLVSPDGDAERVIPALRPQHGLLRDAARLAFGPFGFSKLDYRRKRPRTEAVIGKHGWVVGALLITSREEFLALGGFNERIFLYGEDRDLSARYLHSGGLVGETGAVVGRHVWGGSSGRGEQDFPRLRAWAILSWIQFLSDSQGAAVARRGWLAYRAMDAIARALVLPGALFGLSRAFSDKSAEFSAISAAITKIAAADGKVDGRFFCPDSIAIAKRGMSRASLRGSGR